MWLSFSITLFAMFTVTVNFFFFFFAKSFSTCFYTYFIQTSLLLHKTSSVCSSLICVTCVCIQYVTNCFLPCETDKVDLVSDREVCPVGSLFYQSPIVCVTEESHLWAMEPGFLPVLNQEAGTVDFLATVRVLKITDGPLHVHKHTVYHNNNQSQGAWESRNWKLTCWLS